MPMQRVIVTGANGAGKSHFAAVPAGQLTDIPLISHDQFELLRDWQRRPGEEV